MPINTSRTGYSSAAQRVIAQSEKAMARSMERIASGLKINSSSDDPSSFALSETIRSQVRGIEQAIENTEVDINLLQLTDESLRQIADQLRSINQIAIRSANSASITASDAALYQSDLEEAIKSIEAIATRTRFGNRAILNGEAGYSAYAIGDGLEVVSASENTSSNISKGYDVVISKLPEKASLIGTASFDSRTIQFDQPEIFTFEKDGAIVEYQPERGKTRANIINDLNEEFQRRQLGLQISQQQNTGLFIVEATKSGAGNEFRAKSTTEGVFGNNADQFRRSSRGVDIEGTINGELADGKDNILTAREGNPSTSGLAIRYNYIPKFPLNVFGNKVAGAAPLPRDPIAGRVFVEQNSLQFQIGENADNNVKFSVKKVTPDSLGTEVDNESEFGSLNDVNITTFEQATDSIKVVNKALDEITRLRTEIGALQKFSLESNLRSANVARENLIAANSVISDANLAEEVSQLTLDRVRLNTATAVLAQANQQQENILKLISDE